MDEMIDNTVSRVLASVPQGRVGPAGPAGQLGPPGPAGIDGADGANGTNNRWNATDVGFFDPMYNSKSIDSGALGIEQVSKDTYFRDVYLFI